MGTFESEFGREDVDVDQEAIDAIQEIFGELSPDFASDTISTRGLKKSGLLEFVRYGAPPENFDGSQDSNDVLNIDATVGLSGIETVDRTILRRLSKLRRKMIALGFSAEDNLDIGVDAYGHTYNKIVPIENLRDELTKVVQAAEEASVNEN